MTLHQLRIFLAVAKFRSFTQAADGLHLSQPDVSLHVRGLEEEIGMELDSTEAIKWAVVEGLGVSVVSKHAVSRETKLGVLSMRRIYGLPLYRPLLIVYHSQRVLPLAARGFSA